MDDTTLRTLLIILGVIIVLFVIGSILFRGKKPAWKAGIHQKLDSIMQQVRKADDILPTKALLIEIDSLLASAFKSYGVKGEAMGERLKAAKGIYERDLYNKIWFAHKLRNKLVHEVDFKPKVKAIKSEIYVLKTAIEKITK